MGGGYVLDFGNSSFRDFVRDSVGRDIECGDYDDGSNSKARRLRKFFEVAPDDVVGTLLEDLVEHKLFSVPPAEQDEGIVRDAAQVRATAGRLRHPDHPLNWPPRIRVSPPHGGGSAAAEFGPLADGTNLPEGTDYAQTVTIDGGYLVPAEHVETNGWRDQAGHLRDRLREFRVGSRPVRAWLSQSHTPLPGANTAPAELLRSYCAESDQLQSSFGGCRLEPATPLRAMQGGTLPTLFAFKDFRGKDLAYSSGTPVPLRLGLSRQLVFLNGSNAVSEDRPLRWAALHELLRDCGGLLPKLPAGHLSAIWKSWGGTIPRYKTPDARWVEAVFEHAWRRLHDGDGAAPTREAYIESGYASVVLHETGRFPRLPAGFSPVLKMDIPNVGGYPPTWHSKIDDLAAESLDLLDWIMTFDPPPAVEAAPLDLFISYASEDRTYRADLEGVLRPAEDESVVRAWSDPAILAGQNIDRVIDGEADRADIYVFLISKDFISSDYCRTREFKRAKARAKNGEAAMIGILVRDCDWQAVFPRNLRILPTGLKAVKDWPDQDHAWKDISINLRKTFAHLHGRPKPWMTYGVADD